MSETPFDIVIRGGRVMDPETKFDAIADVGILGDRIAAIGADLGAGRSEIDAKGKIVAPGFIDIHAHGQSIPADRMQAFDGVTTSLELEVGVMPVAPWYDMQAEQGRVLNYGTAAAWILARKAVIIGMNLSAGAPLEMMGAGANDPRWVNDVATDDQVGRIVDMIREGILEGAIGIGIPNAYASGAGVKEMTEVCQLAADTGTPTFTHVAYTAKIDPKSSIEAYVRLIGYAGATGAHMHICHLNSTSGTDIGRAVQILQKAQAQGLPITVEAYPYGTGSTVVSAAFYADPEFPKRTGRTYDSLQVVATGYRFQNRDEVMAAAAKNPGELVLTHFLDTEGYGPQQHFLDMSVTYPGGAIASDAMPWVDASGAIYTDDVWPLPDKVFAHPRSAGTFTRFFRQYVRERPLVPLMEAIEKCTLIPCKVIESCAPAMRRKARMQVGCDADVIVFDLDLIGEEATFQNMNRTAVGVSDLLVNGMPVIQSGGLVVAARPGRPLRSELSQG